MVCLGFSLKGNALSEEAWERWMPGLREQDAVISKSCREGRTAVRLIWTSGKLSVAGSDSAGCSALHSLQRCAVLSKELIEWQIQLWSTCSDPAWICQMCFRGDHSWLAVMEGLRDLQADLLAWLQLENPSQGQHPQGSEQRVELGAEPRAAGGPGWSSGFPGLPHPCASVLQCIVGCVGRASSWEEGIADHWEAKESLV